MRQWLKMLVCAMLVVLTACDSSTAPAGSATTAPAGNATTATSPAENAMATTPSAPTAQSSANQAPKTAGPAATSQADQATVTGSVFSTKTNGPLRTDTPIWFAQVYRNDKGDAAYALDPAHSPAFNVNTGGTFVGYNLAPHEYVVVVGDPYTKYVVISETAGKARVWDIKAGTTVDIGKLEVDVE